MCGITGAIWTGPTGRVDDETLRRMTDVLAHRGPDDRGELRWELGADGRGGPGGALGFRRLAIIDLPGGHQPLANETEDVWVIFNGEIYNHVELRRWLEERGHRFATRSDTETIVHLYEEIGDEVFDRLWGMFAIGIWDARRQRLVLGRDRLGKKPLVYRKTADGISFASELKSLLEMPGFRREIEPEALDDFLTYQYVPHPRTIYRGVSKLPPGHRAVWERGELSVTPYWTPRWSDEQALTHEEAIAGVRELLTDAVRRRMVADVPLGAFLSGGIDSSLIVGLMSQMSKEPIRTFSIAFPHPEFDESRHAKRVAEHFGTRHREFLVTPDAVSILPDLVHHYDEPFGDSSAIPTWYVSQATRREVTVALSGDGGDELFGGYERYRAVELGHWLDRWGWLRRGLGHPVWQRLPSSRKQRSWIRRLKRFSESASKDPIGRYLEWMSTFDDRRRRGLYREDFAEQLQASDPRAFLELAWDRVGQRDPMTCASLADLQTYLPCDLLTKTDIASMAHGLECRQPFLDHRLVEFAIGLPMRYKRRGSLGKLLLREAFAELLPAEIWQRPKMGFGVPVAPWFRNELRGTLHETLLDPQARVARWLRTESISQLISEHQSGGFDHSFRLWSLLFLELWCRRWMD